jgi:hypothetical protein
VTLSAIQLDLPRGQKPVETSVRVQLSETEGLADVDKEIGQWERLLLDASIHVQRARAQRQLLHNKQTKATSTINEKERRNCGCLVMVELLLFYVIK